MTDISLNIDTNNIQLGQVIRINITDQGIFRVFYNDISGNMYCGLSRGSNYKQVVYNSSQNRTVMDNSGMNAPFYGGTYHEEELKHMDNSGNFYIFRYPTTGIDLSLNACDRGPISYFTEVQLQKYIKQGDSSANSIVYNTTGYSSTINTTSQINTEGGNGTGYDYTWYEQVGFGYCTTQTGGYALDPLQAEIIAIANGLNFSGSSGYSTKGLYAYYSGGYSGQAYFGTGGTVAKMKANPNATSSYRPGIPASTTFAMYVPDLQNLIDGTLNVRGVTNRPLNNSYSGMDNMLAQTATRFITEPWGTDISNSNSTPSNFNSKYYISSKRPKLTWLDINNHATLPYNSDPTYIPPADMYYKGRWTIYVDVKNQVYDLSGTTLLLKDNDTSGNIYLSNSNRATKPVFTYPLVEHFTNSQSGGTDEINNVFVDLDLDISRNASNANFDNIYARPYFVIGSDASDNIVYGNAPYDLTVDNSNNINLWDLPDIGSPANTAKYCKIRVNSFNPPVEWDLTAGHIVYYAEGDNYLAYANGFANTFPTLWSNYLWGTSNGKVSAGSGKYPSMELDKNGYPHIAFFGMNASATNNAIHYIVGNNYMPGNDTVGPGNSWQHQIIDPSMGTLPDTGYYNDLSNNQPISLKISPYDDSVHICYQKKNDDGTYSIRYWTDSSNNKDISGVDSSLNYLGIRSQGKTLDISAAYVELAWDLSSAKCIFSRDYTRVDPSTNITTGLNSASNTQQKVKRFCHPFGGRGGAFSDTLEYGSPIIYKATHFDKIYIITRVKTPSSWDGPIWQELVLLGPTATGGILAGTRYGLLFFGVQGNYQSSTQISTSPNSGFSVVPPYKNGTLLATPFGLFIDTNYELEYYYNKTNYYAFIKVKNLDIYPQSTDTYEWFDISQNGGFNMADGPLSIGCGNHVTPATELWGGTIYKMSIYGTDVSNIPLFDISRNGEILTDTSGNRYSSYYDNSGNEGLVIEPSMNVYQVVNAVNDLNIGDISGSSYTKTVVLHDIYYFQKLVPGIFGNPDDAEGQDFRDFTRMLSMDKFKDLQEIWACGFEYTADESNYIPTICTSHDNGRNWFRIQNPSSVENYPGYGNIFTNIKVHKDINGGKWVFVCGFNYLIYVSNNYDINGEIQNEPPILGNSWQTLGDKRGNGDGSPGGLFYDQSNIATALTEDFNWNNSPPTVPNPDGAYSLTPNYQYRDIRYIYTTDISGEESKNIFDGKPRATSYDFHLWVGTENHENGYTLPNDTWTYTAQQYIDQYFTTRYDNMKIWDDVPPRDPSGKSQTTISHPLGNLGWNYNGVDSTIFTAAAPGGTSQLGIGTAQQGGEETDNSSNQLFWRKRQLIHDLSMQLLDVGNKGIMSGTASNFSLECGLGYYRSSNLCPTGTFPSYTFLPTDPSFVVVAASAVFQNISDGNLYETPLTNIRIMPFADVSNNYAPMPMPGFGVSHFTNTSSDAFWQTDISNNQNSYFKQWRMYRSAKLENYLTEYVLTTGTDRLGPYPEYLSFGISHELIDASTNAAVTDDWRLMKFYDGNATATGETDAAYPEYSSDIGSGYAGFTTNPLFIVILPSNTYLLTQPKYPSGGEDGGNSRGAPGYLDMVIRINALDISNNTCDYSYNVIYNSLKDASNNGWGANVNYEPFKSMAFGGNATDNSGGLSFGIVGTENFIFTTKDGGENWDKKLQYDISNSIGYGGKVFSGRGTTGTYVDKGINSDTADTSYNVSNFYVQTNPEPWLQGASGFIVADNSNNYDLSFSPIDSSGIKTITWDPSLNSNSFWNPKTADFEMKTYIDGSFNDSSVKIIKNWSEQNTYQVYISPTQENLLSNQIISGKKYQQVDWTFNISDGLNQGKNEIDMLYKKYTNETNEWQKIDYSVVDLSFADYRYDISSSNVYTWSSLIPIDISNTIIDYPSGDGYGGWYKLSRVPFILDVNVIYPFSGDDYQASLEAYYKGSKISNEPRLYGSNLNINITYEYRKANQIPVDTWNSTGPPSKNPSQLIPNLEPGFKYQFRIYLSNKYGNGWYSKQVTLDNPTPSPDPTISNIISTTKLISNKMTWEPTRELLENGNLLQTVYSYNIIRKYIDSSGNYVTDNSWNDLSGVLNGMRYPDLSGMQFTGPFNPDASLNDISDVSFVTFFDTDLSLNEVYRYAITAYSKDISGQTPDENSYYKSIWIDNGIPENVKYDYSMNDASFNITWTKNVDISTNTTVLWDISWQEIRSGGSTAYGGNISYPDPSNNFDISGGAGYLRTITLGLLPNNHLQADASYNFQIRGQYTTIIPAKTQNSSYNTIGISKEPITYYNYQQPPTLNSVLYDDTTDTIKINYSQPNIPGIPAYYDISLSNTTTPGVSYNIEVPSNNFIDISGTSYYPGSYDVRVKALYGTEVPLPDISLNSVWSNLKTLTNIPPHLPKNFKVTPYNTLGVSGDITDVSYIKLTWDPPGTDSYAIPGFPIPESYGFTRKTANKSYNYIIDYSKNDISGTDISFNDTNFPLANNPTWPRIYRYDLSANY